MDQLESVLQANKIVISGAVIGQLAFYFDLTEKWSKKINITANTTPESYVLENVVDPILAFESLKSLGIFDRSPQFTLADFGCGGGYVGITWHILLGGVSRLVLVDSDRKKINFCREVCRRLEIQRVDIINNRCENLAATHENKLDLIVSRATFSDETLVQESASQLLTQDGKLLLLKGSTAAADPVFLTSDRTTSDLQTARYTIIPSQAHRFVKIVSKPNPNLTTII